VIEMTEEQQNAPDSIHANSESVGYENAQASINESV
jgi:hypothetical protein